MHAVSAAVHRGRSVHTIVVKVVVVIVRVVVAMIVAVVVVTLFAIVPRRSVSVQRLRAAEQPFALVTVVVDGGWPHATVVTPVGVLVIVLAIAVVVIVVVVTPVPVVVVFVIVGPTPPIDGRRRRRFRFLPVLLPARVRRRFAAAAAATGELAHQTPERFAERFLPFLFAVTGAAVRGHPRIHRRRWFRREPRLLVHFLVAGPSSRSVAGPALGFRRVVRFRFRRHGRSLLLFAMIAVRRRPPPTPVVPGPVRVRRSR